MGGRDRGRVDRVSAARATVITWRRLFSTDSSSLCAGSAAFPWWLGVCGSRAAPSLAAEAACNGVVEVDAPPPGAGVASVVVHAPDGSAAGGAGNWAGAVRGGSVGSSG